MGCSATTQDSCTACFNYVISFLRPRALNTSASPPDCKSVVPVLVSGCKVIDGTLASTISAITSDSCFLCNAIFLYWNQSIQYGVCTDYKEYT